MEIKIRFMIFSNTAADTGCLSSLFVVCFWHLKEHLDNRLYGLDPETVTHNSSEKCKTILTNIIPMVIIFAIPH